MRKIACVGAGTIGRAWAIGFARYGFEVSLFDPSREALDQALKAIRISLEDLADIGLLEDVSGAFERIHTYHTLEDALVDVEYVQESIPERVEIKQECYERMNDLLGDDTIIGSSVSSIPGSKFMGGLDISPRCLVVHPTNPPYLTPLTEICTTPWTSRETIEKCEALMAEIGQVTVRVKKEITDYVLNRLQAAVVGESLHLVGEDVISAEDLDKVMVHGLGMRWAFMGPFLTGHLNATKGYNQYMTLFGDVYRNMISDLNVGYEWGPELIKKIHDNLSSTWPAEKCLEGQRWRDRKLMEMRKAYEKDR